MCRFNTPPCVHSKCPVNAGKTPAHVEKHVRALLAYSGTFGMYTRRRFESTYGAFHRATPHGTHTTTTTTATTTHLRHHMHSHKQQNTTPHQTNTPHHHTGIERKNKQRKKTEKEREEKTKEKTRQDEREEDRCGVMREAGLHKRKLS